MWLRSLGVLAAMVSYFGFEVASYYLMQALCLHESLSLIICCEIRILSYLTRPITLAHTSNIQEDAS